jgi:dienelactone hydrolase
MSFLVASGPFGVGSVTRELIDRDRPSHLLSDTVGRRLLLKLWYPAERGTGTEDERIWQELRNDARTPVPVRVLLKCLRARTSTRSNGRFVVRAPTSSVVVYNHGLVSFAAENTSLMQELASHGFAVVAIQHAEQLAEFRALSRAESAEKKTVDAELAQRLKAATKTERPKLAVEYYNASTNTNRVVVERAADTSFVLNRIEDVVAKIPGVRTNAIDTSSARLIGFSVGGAVATETAKRDARARSVVNLDGGMQGTLDAKGLRQPYLMLYSSVNDGMNDELLPLHAQRLAPADTAHLNYHDIAGLLPVLRLARVTGRTNPRLFLEQRNRIVRDFVVAT